MLISWLQLDVKKLRALDLRLGLGQVTQLVEFLRCDPRDIVKMTHTALPVELAPMVARGKAIQFCRACCDRHQADDASGAVLKSWLEAWRITCPECGSPLSEIDQPRGSSDTIRDTSPFSTDWAQAIRGEELVNRHLRGERTFLASPIAMMRLLLILSWPNAGAPGDGYRKSWLLNEIVPGFDDEALRVTPTVSKGATAVVPLHLRVALLAGLATVADNARAALEQLRPGCRPFYLRRFDELANAALGWPYEFSI
jgi:hypothetical protein